MTQFDQIAGKVQYGATTRAMELTRHGVEFDNIW